MPIYPDDPILMKIMNSGKTNMKQDEALFNLKNAYLSEKARENAEMGKILRQQVD